MGTFLRHLTLSIKLGSALLHPSGFVGCHEPKGCVVPSGDSPVSPCVVLLLRPDKIYRGKCRIGTGINHEGKVTLVGKIDEQPIKRGIVPEWMNMCFDVSFTPIYCRKGRTCIVPCIRAVHCIEKAQKQSTRSSMKRCLIQCRGCMLPALPEQVARQLYLVVFLRSHTLPDHLTCAMISPFSSSGAG